MTIDQGSAALITAALSALVSIISLVFASRSQIKLVRVQSSLAIREQIKAEDRELLNQKLSDFYDPILVLLEVNKNVFHRLGPNSSIRENLTIPQEEVAELWNTLVSQVILPNNEEICNIIRTRLHLISPTDDLNYYIQFVTHAYVYKSFREKPVSAYTYFQFPKGLDEHVMNQRNTLYKQLGIHKEA